MLLYADVPTRRNVRTQIYSAPDCQAAGQGESLISGGKGTLRQSQDQNPTEGPARQNLIAAKSLPKIDHLYSGKLLFTGPGPECVWSEYPLRLAGIISRALSARRPCGSPPISESEQSRTGLRLYRVRHRALLESAREQSFGGTRLRTPSSRLRPTNKQQCLALPREGHS